MPSNSERAGRAATALRAYREAAYGQGGLYEPFETALTDLISDLLHLCDEHGEDFDRRLEMARLHFEMEEEED